MDLITSMAQKKAQWAPVKLVGLSRIW